jgi:hypothetical protein
MTGITLFFPGKGVRHGTPPLHGSSQDLGRLEEREQYCHQKNEASAGKSQINGIFFSHNRPLYEVEAFRLYLLRWHPQFLQGSF